MSPGAGPTCKLASGLTMYGSSARTTKRSTTSDLPLTLGPTLLDLCLRVICGVLQSVFSLTHRALHSY